jgi:type 1 fimbria pilin
MQKFFTLTAIAASAMAMAMAAGVAQADDSGVTISGRLNISAESVEAGTAKLKTKTLVEQLVLRAFSRHRKFGRKRPQSLVAN